MKTRILLSVFLIVALIVSVCTIWMFQETTIRVSESPDGRYVLAITKRNIDSFLSVMPGQGSDIKCFVELRRMDGGQKVLRKDVDMLQNIKHIQWDADKVWINTHSAISYEGEALGIW